MLRPRGHSPALVLTGLKRGGPGTGTGEAQARADTQGQGGVHHERRRLPRKKESTERQ